MLVKVCGFLKRAENLAKEFECIKDDIFSISTVNIMFQILPEKVFGKIVEKMHKAKKKG